MKKINKVFDELVVGGDPMSAGIEIASLVSEMDLSLGEITTIEENLNQYGASMYEETYNNLERERNIEWLANDDIKYISRQIYEGDTEYLNNILRGVDFVQYKNMDESDLALEVKTRKEFENEQ